ncbi:MAG: aquaporin [Solirubrobacterales bacterium]
MHKRSITGALTAEFIGSFALVFSIIVVVSMYALQADVARGLTYPFIALAQGLVLFFLLQTAGAVSSGYFNPAVTLALVSIRRLPPAVAAPYIFVQIAGAVLAALVAKLVIPDQADTVSYATTLVNDREITVWAALALEAIFTFFLVWTVVGTTADPDRPKEWAPLAIAGALMLGVLLIAPLTGAGLNPARSIGPALVSGDWGATSDFLRAYVAGPIVGGLIAAGLYNRLYLGEGKPAPAPATPE